MRPKDVAGDEIFAKARFFGRLGDDKMVIDRNGNIAGENEVGDGVKENAIFLGVVAGDQYLGEQVSRHVTEKIAIAGGQLFPVDNHVDHFLLGLLVLIESLAEQILNFENVFRANESLEYLRKNIVFLLHAGQVHNVIEKELFGPLGRNAADTLVRPVYNHQSQRVYLVVDIYS